MRQCRTCGRPSPELICDDCMDEVENPRPTGWIDATILGPYNGQPIEYDHPYGDGPRLIDFFDVIVDPRVPTGVVLCDGVAVKFESLEV